MQYPIFNRKSSLLGVGLFMGSLMLDASPVSQQVAENVARNWMQQLIGKSYHVKRLSTPTASKLGAARPSKAQYHIVQMEEGGWVIVAGDDVARPVLGYGFSKLDPAKLPASISRWLEGQAEMIAAATAPKKSTQKLGASLTKPDPEWQDLIGDPAHNDQPKKLGSAMKLGAPYSIVDPLLRLGGKDDGTGIRWDQQTITQNNQKLDTYNHQTPIAPTRKKDGHMLTGCVATAMGQVLYYYYRMGLNITGAGSHTYMLDTKHDFQYDVGTVSATFGGYDWGNMAVMLDEYSTQSEVDAVSKLLFHLGVAVEMDYGYGTSVTDNGTMDGGSLANYCTRYDSYTGECLDMESDSPSAYYALRKYFGFTQASWVRKVNFSDADWDTILQEALDDGQPVLYGGQGSNGGHAFVLDGYGTDDLYHFNWGYGGQGNGWYRLRPLRLTLYNYTYDFSDNQQALFFGGDVVGVISERRTAISRETTTRTTTNNDPMIGGGCTYNPRSRGVDLMMILMVILSGIYPLGRRYLR